MSLTRIDFSEMIRALASGQVWEYETGASDACPDVPGRVFQSLQRPLDFPPIGAAIVPGDRVALAVDPNVPSVVEVIQGAIKAIGQSEADGIDIVLWDEASDETIAAIRDEVGDSICVVRHRSSDRSALRYVGADEVADPIYLNRFLVDAEFVLPIAVARPLDTCCNHDLTGVFPAFADSASRERHRKQSIAQESAISEMVDPCESSWLLGVQIMLSVAASADGAAGEIMAGTPDAIHKQLTSSRRLPVESWCTTEQGTPDEFPPPAPLVIATIEGDSQQQTWCNAARAVAAASRYARGDGTIVLLSAINEPPHGKMLNLFDAEAESEIDAVRDPLEDDFPPWDESTATAHTLARIASEHRLLIHSRVDEEMIESMGLASINSIDELTRLSRTFNTCGVLRAAQFAGTTIDTTHELA